MGRRIRVAAAARTASGRTAAAELLAEIEEVELVETTAGWETWEHLPCEVILYALESSESPDSIASLSPLPVLFLYGDLVRRSPSHGFEETLPGRGEDLSFLPRHCSREELAAGLAAAAAGLVVRYPGISGAVPAQRVHSASQVGRVPVRDDWGSPEGSRLTAREREVLVMIAEGLPNKTIAAELGITSHTVKFHIASIMQKLGAASRTEAVTVGLRRGIILL